MPAPAHGSPESCSLRSTSRLPSRDRWQTEVGPSDGRCCTAYQRNAPTYPSLAFTCVDLTSSGGLHGLGLLVGIGAAAALPLITVGALSVAASDDAEATEAVVESFELGEAPTKRKG